MKKLVYITGVLCLMTVVAGPTRAQEVSVGIKLGGSYLRIPNSGSDVEALFSIPSPGLDEFSRRYVPERTADTDSTEASTYPGSIGFQGGFFVKIDFGRFSIQPEIYYSRQGGTIETPIYTIPVAIPNDGGTPADPDDDSYDAELQNYFRDAENRKVTTGNLTITEKLHYLQIPVLFKYEMSFGLNVFVGPQLGILIGSSGTQDVKYTKYSTPLGVLRSHFGDAFEDVYDKAFDLDVDFDNPRGNGDNDTPDDPDDDIAPINIDHPEGDNDLYDTYFEDEARDTKRYHAVDFSAVFGIGYEYPLGAGAIGLDVRYNLGLTNMFDLDHFRDRSAFFNNDARQTNQTLQVSLTYRHSFGQKDK